MPYVARPPLSTMPFSPQMTGSLFSFATIETVDMPAAMVLSVGA